MDIKKSIEDVILKHGRAAAKTDPIYDSGMEAIEAETATFNAKNAKDFEKFKKDCLASVAAGEKAVKPWETERDAWDQAIKDLEKEIKAELDKVVQQLDVDKALVKEIDEVNKKIQAYNDNLILGKHDPRAQPLIPRKDYAAKLKSANEALAEASVLASKERTAWTKQKEWAAVAIQQFKDVKGKVSKAKFKGSK